MLSLLVNVDRQRVQGFYSCFDRVVVRGEGIGIGENSLLKAATSDQVTLQSFQVDLAYETAGRPHGKSRGTSRSESLVLQIPLHSGHGHRIAVGTGTQSRDQQAFQSLWDQTAVGHVADVDRPFHVFEQEHQVVRQRPGIEITAMVRDGIGEGATGDDIPGA